MRALLAILAASLWMATPALAQDDDNAETFYLGAGLGDFSTDIDELGDIDDVGLEFDSDRNNTALVDDSDRDPVFGAGIGVTVAERVNLRAENEVVEIDQLEDSHAVWLTAAWRF